MVKVKHFRPFFGNDVDVGLNEKRLILPVKLTQPSLDTVSRYGVAHLLAHGETQPGTRRRRVLPKQQEVRRVQLQRARVELRKLGTPAQAFALGKT